MGNQTKQKQAAARARAPQRRKRGRGPSPFAVVVVALIAAGAAWFLFRQPEPGKSSLTGAVAPGFTLTSAAGQRVALSDYSGRNVVIYFSEGVGCDACFSQMSELEADQQRFDKLGISMVAIMVNSPEEIARDATRFGIRMPILVDGSKQVSEDYDVLGRGMHAGLPGHSFVLVDASGSIRWRKDYPSMFVGAAELGDELSRAMGRA